LEDKIDRYIRNEMSSEERKIFQDEMMENSALKIQVDEMIMLQSSFDRRDVYELKLKLDKLEKDRAIIKPNWIQKRRYWLVAASIFLVIGLFFFWNNNSQEKMLLTYFEQNSPIAHFATRGSSNPYKELNVLLDQKKYTECLNQVNNVLANPIELDSEIVFILEKTKAYCLIGLGNFESASKILENKKDCNSVWLQWYIAKNSDNGDQSQLENLLIERNCPQTKHSL